MRPPELLRSVRRLDPLGGIGLFTDGSCWPKDQSGGWAWIAIDAFGGEASDHGGETHTTNNRMELRAWIEGLSALHVLGPTDVLVYSDSQYVGYGAMDKGRKRNANADLWLALDAAVALHSYVEFIHVKGHSGDHYNEKVDKMASQARKQHRAT